MPVILLTNKYSEKVLNVVRAELPSGFDFISLESASKEELISKAGMADYFLASGRIEIDKEVIESATKLKMIQRTGVGADTLDMESLHAKGINVYINAGVNSLSVAEHTILLMLSVLRRLPTVDASVKTGIWLKNDIGVENRSLNNKVVGLIGVGNIGKKVIKMLQPFGVEIYYYDPFRLTESEEVNLNIQYCALEDLLTKIDILSLHCPLTRETRGIIGISELSAMKTGSYIINTARGPLIDENALVSALQSGKLAGAGLDVFQKEPLKKENPLISLNNVVLTPHVGGLTLETFSKMMRDAFENIRLFEMGQFDLLEDKKFK